MKFMVEFPVLSRTDGGAWLNPANMAEFARVAEDAGFDAVALTDHPAPSKRWLERGGHETLDPFAGLCFFAAVTTRLQLMTYLTVVPYRNPLLLARCMTTVDVVSGGRAVFVCGTGYLKGEFHALGMDFNRRNEAFDEAIEVLKGVWSTDEFSYEGHGFSAQGQIISPGPVSKPHPPLWLGGNAAVVRERVAAWGQGWAPLLTATANATTRTVAIQGEEGFTQMLADLRRRLETHGRSMDEVDVLVGGAGASLAEGAEQALDALGHQAEIGVTWIRFDGLTRGDFRRALDELRAYGEQVISRAR